MATNEGISAALTLKDDIIEKLKEAQRTIEAMSTAATSLAKSFENVGASVANMAKGLKGTGVSLESVFNKDGTMRTLKIVAEAIQGTARKTTAVVKSEAEKQAEAAEKAAKRAEAAEKRRQETMRRSAGYLVTEADNALAMNPKGLEQMKEQLRQLTSLQKRFNAQAIKGNPYLDPAMAERVNSAITRLKGNISGVEQKIRALNTRLATTGKNASMVRTLLMTAFNPLLIQRFLQQMITIRGEFEFAQKSLAVIINDEGKARDMFNEITQIAVRSPFSVSDLLKQTKQLAAYRIEADKLIDTTKMLGDISAGVGVDMNRLILAYGQVKAAEFLKGTELRQFSEAGVNMLGGLADRFSQIYNRAVSVGEVMQMVSKRMVKFADVEAVLRQATEAGGTFYKMQEQQADTLRGKIVNLTDRIQIMFNQVGQSYDGLMKKIITGLENLVSNWKAVSNVLIPILGGKLISGVFGLLGKTTLFTSISKSIKLMNAQALKLSGYLTMATRAGNVLRGTMAGVASVMKANLLSVLTTVVLFLVQAVRNATQLQRELKKIEDDARVSMDKQVQRYNDLLNVAMDTTKAEHERQKALDSLKSEYGNILDIQKVELSNIQDMNDARAQQIELIRQQAYEQARQNALSAAVSAVQSQRSKQIRRLGDSGAWNGFILQYKDEVPGLLQATEQEMISLMDEINKRILDGEIKSGIEIRDAFFKGLLTMSGASEATVDRIASQWGDSFLVEPLEGVFDKVLKQAKELEGFGDSLGVDTSVPRAVEKYREELKKMENVSSEFLSKLSNDKKKMYELNPAKQQLDVYNEIKSYAEKMKESVQNAAANGEFGEVGEEVQKVLNREIEAAFRKAAPENELDLWMLKLFSDLNDEFGNASGRLQSGMMRWENGQDEAKFIKTLDKEIEDLQKDIQTLASGNTPRVDAILDQLGIDRTLGTRAEQLTLAREKLMEYDDMLRRLKVDGGFELPPTATEAKQKQRDIETLATDVINLADGWWKLSEAEQEANRQELGGRMHDLGILEPPTSMQIQDIANWIKEQIHDKIEPVAKARLNVRVDRESEKELNDLSSDLKSIGDDLIDYYKKTSSEKLPKEIGDSILSVIQDRIDAFNKNPNKKTTVELPLTFSLQGISEWVDENGENLSKEAITDLKLLLYNTKTGGSGGGSNSTYKSDLKAFLTDLKKARKEMDKLNDAEDELFVKKLQEQGKKVGIAIEDNFKPTEETLNNIINKYLPKLDKADQIDLRLTWSKEDTSDAIKGLTDEVSRLWDQYDNAKKMEEWGFIPQEGTAKETMDKILVLENKLRAQNTEDATKAAEDIKKKRLEIARTEQEEAAKLMYEANKKALDKVEQAYKDMYDNIAKFQKSGRPQDEIDAATANQIAKSLKDVANAQWDEFKSSEAYAVSFGNLEEMSEEALKGMKTNLEAWKNYAKDALQPTEMQAIIKQIQKIDELLKTSKTKIVLGAIAKAFQEVTEAGKGMKELNKAEKQFIDAQANLQSARQNTAEKQEVYAKEQSAKAGYDLAKAQEAEAEATEKADEATRDYVEALATVNAKLATAKKRISQSQELFNAFSGTIDGVINYTQEFADAFGLVFSDESDAAMKGMSQGMKLIGSAITLASTAMNAYTIATEIAAGATGTLLTLWWPLLAAIVAVGVAVAAFKARDAALEKQIEKHRDNVEKLEKEYEKLDKAIDKALDISSMRQSYAEMNANLAKQRQQIDEALAANSMRKQNDKVREEAEDLREQLDAIDEKVEDTRDKWLEMLGGVTDYQGTARDWASSWLDAFKETGNGLDSLHESFDELYDDLVVGQLWTKIMAPQIKSLQQLVTDAIEDGDIDDAEAAAIRAWKRNLAISNEQLEQEAKRLGIGGTLSGDTLQRGVETVTEQTAQALESILNATRYDVSDTNVRVANIEAALIGEGENTILSHLRSQTRYLADIARIASAVYYSGGHSKGAGALKVIADVA